MNTRNALIVIGKAPVAGQVKTRLIPPLTPRRAAQLYTCFLLDSIALADAVPNADVYLLYVPRPRAAAKLRQVLPAHVRLLPQQGKGIGVGSAYGFRHLLAAGYNRVVLIGSDNPTLPAAYVRQAFQALDHADLVFGPTEDGGYYLIGMSQPHVGVFERITWSTDLVEREVRARAAALHLRVQDIPRWYDVDSIHELKRVVQDVQNNSAIASHTRALLQRWQEHRILVGGDVLWNAPPTKTLITFA